MTDTSQTNPELLAEWDRALSAHNERASRGLIALRLFVWTCIVFWWVPVVVALNAVGVL